MSESGVIPPQAITAGNLGEWLAEARKLRGWSLRDAERVSGVSNAHISQIETGAIQEPGLGVVAKLVQAYGLQPVLVSSWCALRLCDEPGCWEQGCHCECHVVEAVIHSADCADPECGGECEETPAARRERLIAGAAEAQMVINERQRAEIAEERLLQAQARLQQARAALLEDGYFTPEQIGPDIAPRITERIAAERERIRQLAVKHQATYWVGPDDSPTPRRPFALLLQFGDLPRDDVVEAVIHAADCMNLGCQGECETEYETEVPF